MRADDTLFAASARPRRRSTSLVTIQVGRRSAWVQGGGVAAVLDEIGCPRMWCPFRRCLTMPIDRVDDLLAILEHRDRRAVQLTAVDR